LAIQHTIFISQTLLLLNKALYILPVISKTLPLTKQILQVMNLQID